MLAPGAGAAQITCPAVPLADRLEGADIAFVGRLVSTRPAATEADTVYRFVVDAQVRGPVGREIEVLGRNLTDMAGTPLALDEAVGVLAQSGVGGYRTSSCALVDPGGLVSVADEPVGQRIKLVIGLVVLALVIGLAFLRLRRGSRPKLPGAPQSGSGDPS